MQNAVRNTIPALRILTTAHRRRSFVYTTSAYHQLFLARRYGSSYSATDVEEDLIKQALNRRRAELEVGPAFVDLPAQTRRQRQRDPVDPLLRHLQNAFKDAALAAASEYCTESEAGRRAAKLWDMYNITRKQKRHLLVLLVDKAWEILWQTQSIPSPSNIHPRQRLAIIAHDMESCGRPLGILQRVAALEKMFAEGEQEKALHFWEKYYQESAARQPHLGQPDYLELGARMYAASGNHSKATAILAQLFELHPSYDCHAVLPILLRHVRKGSREDKDKAFAAYEKIVEAFGSEFSLHQYDACLSGFLDADAPLYAAFTFRDMIRHKYLTKKTQTEVYAAMQKLRLIFSKCATEVEVNNAALEILTAFTKSRPSYQDQFFKAWLEALMKKGGVISASQAIELMYQRGVPPRAAHFNIFLSTLFRYGDAEIVQKAENAAWIMIDSASKHTQTHRSKHSEVPFFEKKIFPPANPSTFALLVRYYTVTGQRDRLREVLGNIDHTAYAGSTEMLNLLLYSDHKSGRYNQVWEAFHRYQTRKDIPQESRLQKQAVVDVYSPNGRTYSILWQSLQNGLYEERNAINVYENQPKPRELMAQMIRWQSARECSKLNTESTKNYFSESSIGKVISTCFIYTSDLPGTLVSLHILHKLFGVGPTQKTFQTIIKHLSHEGGYRGKSGREDKQSRRQYRLNVQTALRMYRIIYKKRQEQYSLVLDRTGYDVNQLEVLSELIRTFMLRKYPPGEVERLIAEAKVQMGVPDLPTGELDAFNIV
jgi:hypothetical protein